MTITFQYTPQILQRAHELHYKKFFQWQSRLPMVLGFMAIWAGLLLFLILGKEGNRFLSFSLIIFGIVAIAIYYRMLKTTGNRVYKRLKDYHDPITVTINDETIDLNIHDQLYEMPWADITKAIVTDDIVLLYPSESMFYIFPAKNFKEEDFAGFGEMIRSKVEHIF